MTRSSGRLQHKAFCAEMMARALPPLPPPVVAADCDQDTADKWLRDMDAWSRARNAAKRARRAARGK